MAKKNFYVVWEGLKPGIYKSWNDCKAMTQGYPNAKFMGFVTLEEAQQAFRIGKEAIQLSPTTAKPSPVSKDNAPYILNSLSVDAACSGNPGVMEYRGVHVGTGEEWFRKSFELGTNNIGEFLAIVHGLAYLKTNNSTLPIYTDSRTAMAWIRKKHANTKLVLTPRNKALFELLQRAERWLAENKYSNKILKWETEYWGENPADFGRK